MSPGSWRAEGDRRAKRSGPVRLHLPSSDIGAIPACRGGSAHGLLERAIGPQTRRSGNGRVRLISAGGRAAFASRSKLAGPGHQGPRASARTASPSRPWAFDACEGRDGRGFRRRKHPMLHEDEDAGFEPVHASSPTDHVLTELQLYGWRPFQDEADPRPLPEGNAVAGAVADIFDALIVTLGDTRLEPDLDELLWSTVNLFHRAANRVERELDDNEQAQRRLQREQDGSEVKSVELERQTAEGQTLIERRNSMELFRDVAAEQFERHTGTP